MRPITCAGISLPRLIVGLALIAGSLFPPAEAAAAATWMNRILGVDANEVVANSDGSFFIFGVGNRANVLAKLNASGEILWAKKILMPPAVFAGGGSHVPSGDGGAIVMTNWSDGGGIRRSLIARFDQDGNLTRQSEVTAVFSLIIADGNSLYLAGDSADDAGSGQIILARVDLATMSLAWSRSFTIRPGPDPYNPPGVWVTSLRRDRDGGILATAKMYRTNVENADEGLLFKADTSGNAVFCKRLSSPSHISQHPMDIVPLDDGYAFVGMTLEGDVRHNLWVGKLGTAWGFQWQKSLGGCKTDWARRLVLMRNGSLSISAQSDSFSNASDPDALAVNVQSANTWGLNWQKRYWTLDEDQPYEIAEASDGGIVLGIQLASTDHLLGAGSFGGGEGFSAGLLVKADASGAIAANGCGRIPCPAVAEISLSVTDTTVVVSDYALTPADIPAALTASEYKLEDAYVSSTKLCGD